MVKAHMLRRHGQASLAQLAVGSKRTAQKPPFLTSFSFSLEADSGIEGRIALLLLLIL